VCGFTGFLGYDGLNAEVAQRTVTRMADTIMHRGPDDAGVWCDDAAGVALAHRRLSILDLSPAGHQPMVSASGRYVIAFNGEIYNHSEIRQKVDDLRDKVAWRGHSDTETLLAAIEVWGLEVALRQSVGMFAFAVWDREARCLYLARDRIGEKPLYYGWQEGVFVFGSELKALRVHPAFKREINRDAIALYLRHNYVPAPYSIYKGVKKLPPGCFLKVQGECKKGQEMPQPYWSFVDVVEQGCAQPFAGSKSEAVEALDVLLRDSVRQQMVADVPLGAFLSGGIDSSTVVALMQAQSALPVKTFTIGFNEEGYNEAVHAKAVARHLGTEHTELYVTPEQALQVIPKLSTLYDEPFSDSSQIPTFLISELARQHVTVSLSGDGGDELFGGYNRYLKTEQWWNRIQSIPKWARHLTSHGLLAVGSRGWEQIGRVVASGSVDKNRWLNLANDISKLSGVLRVDSTSSLYRNFISHWPNPLDVVLDGEEPASTVTQPPIQLDSVVEQMMVLDTLSYLPDDILVKVDRAAMGASLETRVPMLDHRVVEFAWRLPQSMRVQGGQGKWILRQVLSRYGPKELIERPKMGFGVPIDSWLRGPLRDWAESLLDESRLRQEGFFDPEPIRKKWLEHLSGQRNWQYLLWDVLMFQAWLETE
jgi:asparagine synthase (glutamine-hydrolysing)